MKNKTTILNETLLELQRSTIAKVRKALDSEEVTMCQSLEAVDKIMDDYKYNEEGITEATERLKRAEFLVDKIIENLTERE